MKRPVLILGMVPRITTPIARSLDRQGVAVDVATFSVIERPVGSRAIRNCWHVPDPGVSSSGFVDALRSLIREHRHDMLIPANDVALSAIVQHYGSFTELLHVACPPPEITKRVLDKNQTLAAAQQCGIRIPRSFIVHSSAELAEAGRKVSFPIVLKPSRKKPSDEFKTCVLSDPANLRQRFPVGRTFDPPMLVQEFCRGEGVGVELLMRNGEALAVFQHRRLKELPPEGGVAVIAIAERPHPGLVQSSVALLRALQWEGIAMVEYKVDPWNGAATLMEVNGRYWGTISLPLLAGMNFPLHHWNMVHGHALQVPSAYGVGTKWRWTAGWISRVHDLLLDARRGRSQRQSLYTALGALSEDFTSSVCDALFSSADPMPGIVEILRTIKDLAIADLRRVRRVARPSPQIGDPPAVLAGRVTTLQEVRDGKVDSRT
ncbi:MAG TPA: ATP-grasp domain-containing protein [Candidatus Sulfotelmatobacter sp.]|nr:ATP-grasp domain-containing protein [Candidatus Sulfotelmatobacter sp.]